MILQELNKYTKIQENNILKNLLSSDLDFKGRSSNYASHNFHAFAAKFPPQLPRLFIERLTEVGEVVLDPMMGSGTTIVEGMMTGRKAIGFDIDPLAVQIASIKTTPLKKSRILDAFTDLTCNVKYVFENSPQVEKALEDRFDSDTRKFLDYWFYPETQKELMTLVLAIEQINEPDIQNFFKTTFSSIIITKSGGVSRARDLAHSRPHLVKSKIPKNVFETYSARVTKICGNLEEFDNNHIRPHIEQCDARNIPLEDSTVHLIVTSPPYANAIDYMRAHKFSLVWFGESIKNLAELRSKYIGSERTSNTNQKGLPQEVQKTIESVSRIDLSKGRVLTRYFQEMKTIFTEMFRVLKPGRNAIVVVGSSTMRGIGTQTHTNLAIIAQNIGFEKVGLAKRLIDRNKRMMPARFGNIKSSQIEQRMHEEYVIGLRKPGE